MKKIITVLFILYSMISFGQTNNPAEQLSAKIAQKMKDSLSLTIQQKDQIYDINMGLHNSKMSLRQQHAGSGSLGRLIQEVENTRDSLYKNVLTEAQYLVYQKKKRYLVSNH